MTPKACVRLYTTCKISKIEQGTSKGEVPCSDGVQQEREEISYSHAQRGNNIVQTFKLDIPCLFLVL